MNSFLVFCSEERRKTLNANPELSNSEVSVILGQRWRSFTEEEKAPFFERSVELKKIKAMEAKKMGNQPKPVPAIKQFQHSFRIQKTCPPARHNTKVITFESPERKLYAAVEDMMKTKNSFRTDFPEQPQYQQQRYNNSNYQSNQYNISSYYPHQNYQQNTKTQSYPRIQSNPKSQNTSRSSTAETVVSENPREYLYQQGSDGDWGFDLISM